MRPNVALVRDRVERACARVGRSVDDVTIVAVTKYASVAEAGGALAAGVRDLGENQAQQLRDRAGDDRLRGARWHFLGRLQTNKARYVAPLAVAFHALDRIEAAEALSVRRPDDDPLDCYIEVNVAREATKSGVDPASVPALVERAAQLSGVRLAGVMVMPPVGAAAEDSRRWFRMAAAIAVDNGLAGLSMGTSQDYEVAVEEGATAVRVGSALFHPGP
jgi:PLP dependent protein